MDLQTIAFKGIINTIVRLIPISLYMGTSMSFLLYNNKPASILLIGFFFIEIIGFVFSYNSKPNPQCGLFRSPSGTTNLPAPVPTVVGFFAAFLIAEMYAEENFRPNKFFLLITLVLISTWSRVNIGCHTVVESGMAALIGLFLAFSNADICPVAIYSSNLATIVFPIPGNLSKTLGSVTGSFNCAIDSAALE